MALSRITQGAAAANNASVSVAEGDIIVVFAYNNSSNTQPSLATDFTNIANGANSGGGTNRAYRVGYRVAPSGGLSGTGTWTNATHVTYIVLRGQKVSGPIGATSVNSGNNAATSVTFNALNLTGGEAGQWLLGMIGRVTAHANLATAPSGMVNHASSPATPSIAAHSTDAIRSTNWSATSVTGFSTSVKFSSIVIEVLAEPDSITVSSTAAIPIGGSVTVTVSGGFDSYRRGLIDGLVSDKDEPNGWNVQKANIPDSAVTRISASQAKLVIPPLPGFDITELETLTDTIPGGVLTTGAPIVATPTFTIAAVAAEELNITTTKAVPLAGTVAAAVALALGSVGTVPLGGAAELDVGATIESVAAVPIGAVTELTVVDAAVNIESTGAVPLGGTGAIAVGVSIEGVGVIPLSGSASIAAGIAVSSSQAVPISGSAELAAELTLESTGAVPLAGTANLEVADPSIGISSNQAVPLGWDTELIAQLSLESIQSVPLSGAVEATVDVALESVGAVPLGGSIIIELPAAPREIQSTQAVPLGGSVEIELGALPELEIVSEQAVPLSGQVEIDSGGLDELFVESVGAVPIGGLVQLHRIVIPAPPAPTPPPPAEEPKVEVGKIDELRLGPQNTHRDHTIALEELVGKTNEIIRDYKKVVSRLEDAEEAAEDDTVAEHEHPWTDITDPPGFLTELPAHDHDDRYYDKPTVDAMVGQVQEVLDAVWMVPLQEDEQTYLCALELWDQASMLTSDVVDVKVVISDGPNDFEPSHTAVLEPGDEGIVLSGQGTATAVVRTQNGRLQVRASELTGTRYLSVSVDGNSQRVFRAAQGPMQLAFGEGSQAVPLSGVVEIEVV